MPIKLLKRKRRKPTHLKQKQSQVQKQHVTINLGDLIKQHRKRQRPLVEPKQKLPSEMVITRVIHPYTPPPYQNNITPTPVKVTTEGIEQPKYVPENYTPNVTLFDRLQNRKNEQDKLYKEKEKLYKQNQDKLNKKLDDTFDIDIPEIIAPPDEIRDHVHIDENVHIDEIENPLMKRGKATKQQMDMRGFRTEQLMRQHEKLGTPSPSKRQILDHLKKVEFEERLKDKLKQT